MELFEVATMLVRLECGDALVVATPVVTVAGMELFKVAIRLVKLEYGDDALVVATPVVATTKLEDEEVVLIAVTLFGATAEVELVDPKVLVLVAKVVEAAEVEACVAEQDATVPEPY